MVGAENRRLQQWLESQAQTGAEQTDNLLNATQQEAQGQGERDNEPPNTQMPDRRLDPGAMPDLLMPPAQRRQGSAPLEGAAAAQPSRENPLPKPLASYEAPTPSSHLAGAEATRRVVQVGTPVNRSNVVILPKRERVGQVDYGSFLSTRQSASTQDVAPQTLQQQPDTDDSSPATPVDHSLAAQEWLLQQQPARASAAEPAPIVPEIEAQKEQAWHQLVAAPAVDLSQQDDGPLEEVAASRVDQPQMAEVAAECNSELPSSDELQEVQIEPPESAQPEPTGSDEEREKGAISMVQIEALLNQALAERQQQQQDEVSHGLEQAVQQGIKEPEAEREPAEKLHDARLSPEDESLSEAAVEAVIDSSSELTEHLSDPTTLDDLEETTERIPTEEEGDTKELTASEQDTPLSSPTRVEDAPAEPDVEISERALEADGSPQGQVEEPLDGASQALSPSCEIEQTDGQPLDDPILESSTDAVIESEERCVEIETPQPLSASVSESLPEKKPSEGTHRVAQEILLQIEKDLPAESQEPEPALSDSEPSSNQTTTIPAAELTDVELDEESGEVVDEMPVPKVSRIQQRRRLAKASQGEMQVNQQAVPKPVPNPGFLFGRLKDRRAKLAAASLEDPADIEQQMRQPKPLMSELKRHMRLPKSMWLPFGWYAMGTVVNNISDGAIRWYQRITRLDADVQSAFLLDRARHLQRLERMEEAKDLLEIAITLEGASSRAHLLLAEVLQSLEMHAQAEQVLFKALNNGYDDADLYLRLGSLMLDGERAEAAIAYLRQAVAMEPDLYDGLTALGKALWQSNAHEESLAHLERAREIRPFDPCAFMLTGEVLESLQRDEDAALFYQQADALNNMLQAKPAHERVEPDELS
uniref:Uncharacterized protein n=1 Tax=Magnetococcus massalia (strain MO-1) TaxID=451514 RepID=A0A1S7LF91_MAGMO|nr:Conserved protein of unknown function. Containing tetratricopeptide TPR_2 repeat [Candidatus Magnetococcus massalia]